MGEYAFRKSDGENVKIGTCESMYYLRYEDRDKVRQQSGSLNPATELNLFWRLPFPDEDNVQPGEYDIYNRGWRLWREGETYAENLLDEIKPDDAGTIQLTHESGLMFNVKCYHGTKLPEVGQDAKAFWNGKSWSLELCFLKNTTEGIKPVVRCRHCNRMWRFEWDEIMPYINIVQGQEIKSRLEQYAQTLAATV